MNTYTKAQLQEILESHKLWLNSGYKKGKRADLRKANLSGADLSGADLLRANLSGADLSGADLSGADLFRTNLTNATGLIISEPGKAYKLKKGYSFYVKSLNEWKLFENNETGLILGIHGTQNENHLDFDKGRSSFDLLLLDGDKKGQVWKGIDWWVLLTYFSKEIK